MHVPNLARVRIKKDSVRKCTDETEEKAPKFGVVVDTFQEGGSQWDYSSKDYRFVEDSSSR